MEWTSVKLLLVLIVGETFVMRSCQAQSQSQSGRVKIDAAFTMNDTIYFLKGDEAIPVTNHTEDSLWNVPEWLHGPLGFSLQAAFFIHDEIKVYLYGPNRAMRINTFYQRRNICYDNIKRQFIQNGGPDAAGRFDGKVYIFKGCEFVEWKRWAEWGEPQNLQELGLPCDIDAAWRDPEGPEPLMTILKGDQIWEWTATGIFGPKDFHSEYSIQSWRLDPY